MIMTIMILPRSHLSSETYSWNLGALVYKRAAPRIFVAIFSKLHYIN